MVQVGPDGRQQAHRHVLPPGLVRGCPPGREVGHLARDLRHQVGVVVLDLVVVPGDDPRAGGVGGLQRRVTLVEPVAVPVGGQVADLGAVVPADAGGVDAALVDVIAEVQHDVGLVAGRMGPQGPVARLPVLAAGEQEPQAVARPARPRRGPRAPDRADLVAHDEPVVVPAPGPEAVDIHVHRVRPPGLGDGDAVAHDLTEALVLGHLPPHRHGVRRHAAVGQRCGGEARPEDDRPRQRVARGHPEGEEPVGQVRGQRRGLAGGRPPGAQDRDGGAGGQRPREEPPPRRRAGACCPDRSVVRRRHRPLLPLPRARRSAVRPDGTLTAARAGHRLP